MNITNFPLSWTTVRMSIKLLSIAFLTLFLLIPRFMIQDLVEERSKLNDEVSDDVASSWSGDQLISGPYLSIPYLLKKETTNDKTLNEKSTIILVPDSLNLTGNVTTESKSRSIYNVLLYNADINLEGNFNLNSINELKINTQNILWEEAFLSFNISDPKGIREEVFLKLNSQKIKMLPGMNGIQISSVRNPSAKSMNKILNRVLNSEGSVMSGLHSKINITTESTQYNFSIPIKFKGSRGLVFAPTAKKSSFKITSPFTDPSFLGEYLPEHNLSDSGFTAQWNILEYNKTLPNYFLDTKTIQLGESIFGINIQNPINHYSKTERASKYLILFIIVIFLSMFITEIYHKIQVHIFQYGMIGLSIIIFFALLLSISEFLSFDYSYILGSCAVTTLIFLYSRSVFSSTKSSNLLSGLVILFFTFIFIIIQLEQTALLVGTIMLFIILASTMYVTRNIKWNENSANNNKEVN